MTLIVAENCTNWRDLTEAKEMIRVAREIGKGSGVEVLSKFQLFSADDDIGKPHYPWTRDHALTFEQAKELFEYGKSIGQEVFFSVFKAEYVDWCEQIGVKRYKLASRIWEINKELLTAVILTGKPLIVSAPYETTTKRHTPVLYCPPGYPQTALRLADYSKKYQDGWTFQGFSDHTLTLDAAKIALARGASIVEKHFVLAHSPDYPDNDWSMTPDDLRELVRWAKVCDEVIG